eukprot:4266550-Prymnesium_polylepis.1
MPLQPNQRLLHLQRHGQGFHNLSSELLRNLGVDPKNAGANHPYKLPEMVDPPLTDKGRAQCKARQETAAALTPPLVMVSPLCRAIQTALTTFQHLVSRASPTANHQRRVQPRSAQTA